MSGITQVPAMMMNGAGPAVSADQMENIARTAHRANITPKSRYVRFRTKKDGFKAGVSPVFGIRPKSKKGPRGGMTDVHAILFDTRKFTPATAKRWLKAHGFVTKKFYDAKPKLKITRRKKKAKKKRKAAAANMMPQDVFFQYAGSMNPVEAPTSIKEAIKLVQKHAPSPQARAYADAAMQASLMYGMEGLRVQVLYIVGNLSTWRGELARETKKFIKAWLKAQGMMKNPEENPSLMILTNPTGTVDKSSREFQLANKGYKRWHFKDSSKAKKRMVPDDWPKNGYYEMGKLDRFDVKSNGKTVSRTFTKNKPIIAGVPGCNDVFLVATNGKPLKIKTGTAVRIDYTVPPGSGRTKWSRRWYHMHETGPKAKAHKAGKHVRISGPGLSITPRGIVG